LGWLSGWTYRKSHVINSASGAGTNYQVKIIAHYGSGTDSNADVYLNGHCRTDFGDVRFTDDDGTTLLDYWMESKVDSDYAIFWVEVADDLSSNNATIYIYYGKSDATTTSNGENTFLFFDDFPGTSLDANKWNSYTFPTYGSIIVTDGEVRLKMAIITAKQNTFSNYAMEYKAKAVLGEDVYEISAMGRQQTNNPQTLSPSDTYLFHASTSTNDQHEIAKWVGGSWTRLVNTANPISSATYYIFQTLLYGTSLTFKRLSTTRSEQATASATDSSFSSGYVALRVDGYSSSTERQSFYDWVFVRKYVSPEPSHGSWGSEEQAGGVTYEIYVDAISQSLATTAYETTYNIVKDASVASQSLTAQETTFNLLKEAIAKALSEISMEAAFNIERDALARALALAFIEAISGVIEIFKDATATAQASFDLESTFNINPEATVKVVAEFSVVKPTEVKITRLFLVMGDLAIQIQGN
jgi:hypothetical protein